MTQGAPPAGWYQHPGDPAVMRHWDGQQWTGHTAPTGTVEAATPGAASDPALPIGRPANPITLGVILAIVFPLGGLVVGIVLLFKDRVGPGLACILLSVLAATVTYALLYG